MGVSLLKRNQVLWSPAKEIIKSKVLDSLRRGLWHSNADLMAKERSNKAMRWFSSLGLPGKPMAALLIRSITLGDTLGEKMRLWRKNAK